MKKNIWLSYLALPYTTASYYERALKTNNNVLTFGPTPNDNLLSRWNLENIRSAIHPLNIECSSDIAIDEIKKAVGSNEYPDAFIWIESGTDFFPENLVKLKCPKIAIFIDSHINLEYQLKLAKNFDFVFIAQVEYLKNFKSNGIDTYWLPLAADIEIHKKFYFEKIYPISFVGTIYKNTRRYELIERLKSHFDIKIDRLFLEEMAKLYSQSKIIFNNSINNDLNMRVFESMSTGSLLLTDNPKNSNQEILFKDNEDLILYSDEELVDKAKYYINNDAQREKIAARGNELVNNAHQYLHRIKDLLDVVFNKKKDTYCADELRHLSLGDKKSSKIYINYKDKLSIIIPVLDYSPASTYNINTLLNDLINIDAEVIVIFNNQELSEHLKNHSRINRFAILNQNYGVSRAWNIGKSLSNSKYSLILNSDLHIEENGIKKLADFLNSNNDVAMVGPQGAFFDYKSMNDYFYFNKNSFSFPIKIDAVSGFYFMINNELFDKYNLSFDNSLTPCYREEWDIGLQIRRAGLSLYLVPINDYEHKWSGSINSYRSIKFMDYEETIPEIHNRTGQTFKDKWDKIYQNEQYIESLWKPFAIKTIEELIKSDKLNQAKSICDILLNQFPKCKYTLSTAGLIAYHCNNYELSIKYYRDALEIDSNYSVAEKNLQEIYQRHPQFS